MALRPQLTLALLPSFFLATACGSESATPSDPPVHAEPVAAETELLRLTLTSEAIQRLGIETVTVGEASADPVLELAGEVVVPPTSGNGVPIDSSSNLQQIASQQAAADADIARATAQAELTHTALQRAEELVRAEAGSIRARDEAAAALITAQATLEAARQQRRLLGQSIGSLGSQGTLWVRASIFATDLAEIRRGQPARIRPLGGESPTLSARPVNGPPSADSAAGSTAIYYAFVNRGSMFRIGQRVAVDLPAQGQSSGLAVPSAAILRDIYGGEWVYVRTSPTSFVRERVAVGAEQNGQAILARGLEPGIEVVTAGAAELFGTEFGAAH